MRVNFRNFYSVAQKRTVWKNEKFTLTQKISRQILLMVKTPSDFTSKQVDFTKFCQKSLRLNFHNFYMRACCKKQGSTIRIRHMLNFTM